MKIIANIDLIMKEPLQSIARFLLYLLSGVLTITLFVGLLWLTNGYLSGYISFAITLILAGLFLIWILRQPESSGLKKTLKALPCCLALLLISWSMVPLPQYDFRDASADPGFELWQLSDSRTVSVSVHLPPDSVEAREETILFVHGGPGAYVRDFDRNFLSSFTKDGYRVLIYDQVGAGRSPRVPMAEYTHSGNVDDLRAVLRRLNSPVILFGQSYGTGVISSFLADYSHEFDIRKIILTEPSPLPGVDMSIDHPHFSEKTTKAENVKGLEFSKVINNPRILIAVLLPSGHSFVDQEEVIGYFEPDLHKLAVSNSYCLEDEDRVLPFEPLPANLMATLTIQNDFTKAARPDLRDLPQPVLLLLGECSYLPRGYAMEYFEHYTISRSHWIDRVGHVLWATPEGRDKTYAAITSFLNGTEAPLENKPTYETRIQFIEDGF